ncbi:MAG: hypothetical protein WAW23_07490 [Candidatus Methanoperedens sp.]
MERLTKRQRTILTYLDKIYPFSERRIHLIIKFKERELGDMEDNISAIADITLLEKMQLVEKKHWRDGEARLTITPKGKEKLRENFKTRLVDAIYDNPLKAISIAVALILGLIALWK